MNGHRLTKIRQRVKCFSNIRRRISRLYPEWVFAREIIVVLFLLLFVQTNAHSQTGEEFGVKTLIRNLKDRFNLSATDLKTITPLIKQENENVILIYARLKGDEEQYSQVIWQEIVELRRDFEARIRGNLTTRQKAALQAARTTLEDHILRVLIGDFVSFLDDFLYLSNWQFQRVRNLLESENNRKYQLIIKDLLSPEILQTELKKISEETERDMEKILSPKQLRDYRSLGGPRYTFIASMRF